MTRPPADFALPDFDGVRLAYPQRPCTVGVIVVWDLTGSPPGLPRGDCPAMRLGSRDAQVDLDRRRVALRLACPADPPLGCAGTVTVSGRRPGSRRPKRIAEGYPRLASGTDQAVELRMSRRLACSLVRDGDVAHAKVEIVSLSRVRVPAPRTRRSLVLHGLSACDG